MPFTLTLASIAAVLIHLTHTSEYQHIINPKSNITCPNSPSNGTCLIECIGNATVPQCKGLTLDCGTASNCTIKCSTNACFQSTLIHKNVQIFNLFMSEGSFLNGFIFANMLGPSSVVNIECFNADTDGKAMNCVNGNWKFIAYNHSNNNGIGSVYIQCDSLSSCSNTNIWSETMQFLSLNCSGESRSNSNDNVCSNSNVSTPIFGKTNILITPKTNAYAPHFMNLYCLNGLNNLEIFGIIFPQTQIIIHCGLNYENKCDLSPIGSPKNNCSNECKNEFYNSSKHSLQISIPNLLFSNETLILTDIHCEANKACFVYPQSLLPLPKNENKTHIFRFHCADKQNCTVVYGSDTLANMQIRANDTNHTSVNCNHFLSDSIIGDCRNSNISANNAQSLQIWFNDFGNGFNRLFSFANASISAMNVTRLQIDGFHYYSHNLTVYTSLQKYDGTNVVTFECERCSFSDIYYLNNPKSNEHKMDYLSIHCGGGQTSCNEMTVFYDLNRDLGCAMQWNTNSNSFVCVSFDNLSHFYDDHWWTFVIFIPVAVILVIGLVYLYRLHCANKKDNRAAILGYGAISDA